MTEGSPDRALAGLGAFSRSVAIGTVLAVAIAAGAWKLLAAPPPSVRPEPFDTGRGAASAQDRLREAESKDARAVSPLKGSLLPQSSPLSPSAAAASSFSSAIERRHADGALQEAVKRFAPCPGGDVRRTAWIDGDRLVKLAHEKADGLLVEEWFDGDGHLREAVVRGRTASATFTRRVLLDDRGTSVLDATSPEGVVLDAPPPPLQLRDPSAGFFAGPGCVR
jgi:hypothetical protein